MADPRGHHVLPQTYQRGFANAKGQVRILERATGQGYTTHMRNAFKRRDWNSVMDEEGKLDHTAELLLAEGIDAPASPGLQQLRAGDLDLAPEHRVAVGAFIAAQMGRAPHVRETLGKFEAEVAQHMLALAAQHYSDERWEEVTGERPTPEVRAAIIGGEALEIKAPKAELFVSQQVAHDLAPMLAAMAWTLVEFDEPCLFTSGHPVVYLVEAPPPPMIGVGFGTADATYVPLTPSHALTVRAVQARDQVLRGTRELARKLNIRMLTAQLSELLLLCPDVSGHPLPAAPAQASFPYELL